MKFKLNDIEFEIIEVNQKEYKEYRKKEDESLDCEKEDLSKGVFFGATHTFQNKVFLDKGMPKDRKRKTLIHELTHAYINEYITHMEKQYDEETVADISANSHDIIHKIVSDYFKE